MKTSKLFLTSLLAAAAMSVPANADIYISYGANNGNDSSGNGALTFDSDSGWNKATNNTNSTAAASTILKDTSGADSGVTTTWSSKNSYRVWETTPPADAEEVLKGYLDDGGSQAQITVSNISYTVYDVVVLAATDTSNANFAAVTINGTAYTSSGGIAVEGNTAWGASRNATIVPGVNSMTLSGVTGDSLSINGGAKTDNTRGGIAGIQIFDQTGRIWGATLSGDVNWGDISWSCTDGTEPDAKAWSAITADNLTADLSGTGTVTVGAEGVTLNRLRVLSGTTTLAGGIVTFGGSQNEIDVLSGATLAFDTAQISRAEGVSSVTLAGAGTIAFTDADGTAAYNKIGTNFTASSDTTVRIDGAVNLGESALAVSSGIRELAGGLTAGAVNLTGGSLKISGGALSGTPTISFAGGGNLQFSKADGNDSATYSVGEIGTKERNNTSTEITIDSGVTVNATSFNNAWGMKSLTVDGVLDVSSGTVAMGSGNVTATISGMGEISAKTFNFGNAGKYNFSGVTLNVGSGGITHTNAWGYSLSLGAMVVKATADFSVAANSGGVGTGTTNLTDATTGTTFNTNGFNVAVNTGFGGVGKLVKAGAGTLMLNQASTYSGGTVIEAGTLVAGSTSALGTGNVTVANGATLERGLASGSVAIGGTLTTEGSAILSTGALNENTAAFAVAGNVTLSAGTIFDVGALANGQVVSSAGTLTVADSGTFTKNNFLLNGSALGDRTRFDVSTTGNAVTISNLNQDAYTLTWFNFDESGSAVWSNGCSGWSYQASETSSPSFAETFQVGDSVIFSDDSPVVKNVVVDGAVSVGTMTIDSDADFAFSGQNGAAIGSSGALTKTGTGTATIDSTVDLSRIGGGIVVNGGKLVVDTASGYTGAVTADENGTFTLNVSLDTTLSNTLSVAGTFEKTGARTLTVSSANEGLTGQFVISQGTVKLGTTGNVFGADEREAVVVNAGGTLDVNGKAVFYKVELAGGELVNNGSGIDTNTRQLSGMRLSADSSVISKNNFGLISYGWAGNRLDLAGHTLTKTGSNMFWLVSTNVTAGVIDVREGALVVMNGNSAERTFSMAEGALIKINGGELKAGVIPNGTYRNVSLGNVAIVLTDANKGTAHITVDTNCSFNAGSATLYLDIGALTAATLTPGEDVSLTIAAASAIANDSFFSTVEVGTYVDDAWQISSEWKYLAGSWNASAGTLSITAIPEPSVFGLLAGLGALALAGTRRRRRKA